MTRADLLALVAATLAAHEARFAHESYREFAHRLAGLAVPFVEEGATMDATMRRLLAKPDQAEDCGDADDEDERAA